MTYTLFEQLRTVSSGERGILFFVSLPLKINHLRFKFSTETNEST
jgi:hypothetical protein